MPAWRYIAEDGVTASAGLAADELLARRREGPLALRLYTYRSHCALIGRYQRLETEVNLECCQAQGIAVNRRPTGGGAILMGADQLGVALTIPAAARPRFPAAPRELFPHLAQGLLEGLHALGIPAAFHRKNDLEVRGRKIAGLGIFFAPEGGLLFHASLVVGLDIPLMLRALRTPFEKLADKAVATVGDRMTTVRRELGLAGRVADVREVIREGYAKAFRSRLEPGPWTIEETVAVASLERARYGDPRWVHQEGLPAEASGQARVKTAGGLLEVHLQVRGDHITACCLSGDFFAAEGTLAALERGLKRVAATPEAIRRVIATLSQEGIGIEGIPTAALAAAVAAAAADSRQRAREGRPYGCFVTP